MPLNERSLIGQEVAGYYIEDIVGKGGMAVVYLALDPRLSRRVALKILNPVLSVDDRFRQRFILESRTVASIEHPNIIPIYEANADVDGVLYIAMRYVDGLDLRRLIYDRGPLPIGQANQIFAQVAAALDAAHAHDLIHRDVKPANILLAGDHVYLTDFGITKHRSSISGLTQTDQFIGTPRYMSPEQINKEHIDGRCDQYALACVVYEALSGRLPFQRENDIALLWAHLAEQPAPLSQLRPELPAQVDGVIMRALAKSPEQRYATCTEFVTALRDAISGRQYNQHDPFADPFADRFGGLGSGPGTGPLVPPPGQSPHSGPYPVQRRGAHAAPGPGPGSGPHSLPGAGSGSGPRSVPGAVPGGAPQLAASFTQAPGVAGQATRESGGAAKTRRPGRIPIVAATLVAAVAALALVAFVVLGNRADTWATYKTSTAAPLTFDYPGDWTVRTHQDLFAVASSYAPEFEDLFVSGPGADWSKVKEIVNSDPEGVAGVYVQVSDTLDAGGTAEMMKPKMEALLPGQVDLDKPVQDQAGSSPATRFDGSLHDPASGARLAFVSYVIDRKPKSMLIMYFCGKTTCDDATQTRIRQSVRLS
ncbi:serine/threonine protein kinase [[Actinomadura] parvosata subsp. kistnae]|uniref:non-specific serine/threonine protein kinase n=1 Tax=[Actinomadura] parvosata subsp. kistnae TaxID=1909395 RepID=A0A1V0A4G4_9ACTN|nr:serine/threonine-protein kinase [Nonomuraea sp. ATCC 55076]AQZ65049.1 serine/threonine protein kinase [Nonomuraea sp. ATCC 55076]SPL96307.1 serine/threonine protein kinase [Actinomadura parvosata subsp. kistnae]